MNGKTSKLLVAALALAVVVSSGGLTYALVTATSPNIDITAPDGAAPSNSSNISVVGEGGDYVVKTDGDGSIHRADGSVALNNSTDWAISVWVKPTKDTNQTIIATDQSSSGTFVLLKEATSGDGKVNLVFGANDANANYENRTLTTGEWHHVVLSFDQSTSTTSVVVDNGQTDTWSSTTPHDGGTVTITESGGFSSYGGFVGAVEDVRIYQEQLNSTEISDLYSTTGLDGATAIINDSDGSKSVANNTSFTIDVSQSLPSPNTTNITYEVDWNGDGTYSSVTVNNGTVTHKYTTTGTYNATLKVTNATSGTNDTDTISVEVLKDGDGDHIADVNDAFTQEPAERKTIDNVGSEYADRAYIEVSNGSNVSAQLIVYGVSSDGTETEVGRTMVDAKSNDTNLGVVELNNQYDQYKLVYQGDANVSGVGIMYDSGGGIGDISGGTVGGFALGDLLAYALVAGVILAILEFLEILEISRLLFRD